VFYQYRDAVKVNKDSYQNKGVEPLNTENIKACGAKTYRSHIPKPWFCQGEIMGLPKRRMRRVGMDRSMEVCVPGKSKTLPAQVQQRIPVHREAPVSAKRIDKKT